MSRPLVASLRSALVLATLCGLVSGPLGAEPGETKEFKDKNFTWTLPSGEWSFQEPAADAKQHGYVVTAECREDGGILAEVRVVAAEGLSPEDIANEVLDGFKADFEKTTRAGVTRGKLSGLDGSLAVLQGTHTNGAAYWVQAFAIVHESQLHQLILRAFNGAEGKRAKELGALKRAYRLIKGAGPEEAEENDAPIRVPDKVDEGDAGDWPAGGPKREGAKVIFPSHNLEWTLPEGSPFRWAAVSSDERKTEQMLIAALASLPRSKPADGEPSENRCQIQLVIGPLRVGATAEGLVNSPGVQQQFIQGVYDGKNDTSKTKITTGVDVGNFKGSRLTLAGGQGKTIVWFIFQAVTLKSTQYEWRIRMEGGKEILQEFGGPLGALFKGIHFPDIKEAVRGPVGVDAVPAHNGARGHSVDKESKTPSAGLEVLKPKGLAQLPFDAGADPQLRFAWEGRSADGLSYIYFDVHGFPLNRPNTPRMKPEDLIKERESQWRTAGGDDAVTVTKGKEPWFKAGFGGADGMGYRFTGSMAGHPFVEQGWVVDSKGTLFWLRVQFGGANAEKTMDGAWKGVKKGVKFP